MEKHQKGCSRRLWWFAIVSLASLVTQLRFLGSSIVGTQSMEQTVSTTGKLKDQMNVVSSRIVLYITTHFSDSHIRYFHCCWPTLVRDSPLIRQSHVMVAATNNTPIPIKEMEYLHGLFSETPSFQILWPNNVSHLSHCEPYKEPLNPNNKKKVSVSYKQCLANYGVAFGWSRVRSYDWMIRLNPDVVIRQSQWMLRAMTNTSLDAIVIHCGPNTRQLHTDFWAVRPQAVNATLPFQTMGRIGHHLNHERTAFQNFRSILAMNRHMWVPHMDPSQGVCRARGPQAPISHEHDSCRYYEDTCHALDGWDPRQ